jgi:uncharacterized protein YigE (DUF2233 family)
LILISGLTVAGLVAFFRSQAITLRLVDYLDDQQQETRPLKLVDAGKWRALEPGLDVRTAIFRRQGRWLSSFRLIALRVDPARLRLHVVEVPAEELPEASIETVAARSGALALLNASYFEPEMKVMGLLIADGQQLSPLRKEGSIHHGVFLLRDGQAFLLHRTSVDLEGVTEAFQAGPWLVTDGQPEARFRNADLVSRRSAIGVDRSGRVLLAATDAVLGGLSLPELAAFFAASEPKGLAAWRAINCDGGTSTQLLLEHKKRSLRIRSTVHVPVYIGVYPP